MKTVNDLYWLVFIFGAVVVSLLTTISACVWYMMREVVRTSAHTSNIDDTIRLAWKTSTPGRRGEF